MAEPLSTTAIVPTSVDSYALEVKDFDAAGRAKGLSVPFPKTEYMAGVQFKAALLKSTTWAQASYPMVVLAVMYSDSMGLDILAGDVYMAQEGRFATTADAKIKHALRSGVIEGYTYVTEEGPACKIPWKTKNEEGVYEGPNFKVTVTVQVKGWKAPLVYVARLKEWFEGRNPNWKARPAYMLEKNAISKALTLVAPMGVEADEAPFAIETEAKSGAAKVVEELKKETNNATA